jgi:Methyltransferase domain
MAAPTKADYGLDAPGVVVGNAAAGGRRPGGRRGRLGRPAPPPPEGGGNRGRLAGSVGRGRRRPGRADGSQQPGRKLTERDRLLDQLPWRGDERILDVGCGRGLLLIGAAKRLVSGRAVGLDLWRTKDQAGNDPAATIANARAEGVAERVELCDGDARRLPFDSQSFDLVVSSLALHNIPGAGGGPRRSARSRVCSSRAAASSSSTSATPASTRRGWPRPGSATSTAPSAALACIHRCGS